MMTCTWTTTSAAPGVSDASWTMGKASKKVFSRSRQLMLLVSWQSIRTRSLCAGEVGGTIELEEKSLNTPPDSKAKAEAERQKTTRSASSRIIQKYLIKEVSCMIAVAVCQFRGVCSSSLLIRRAMLGWV